MKVASYLECWNADDLFKNGFKAWIKGIEQNKSPLSFSEFKLLPPLIQSKFECLFNPYFKDSIAEYSLISKKGVSEVSDSNKVKKRKGLVVIEDMGEVFFNQIEIQTMKRRLLIIKI